MENVLTWDLGLENRDLSRYLAGANTDGVS